MRNKCIYVKVVLFIAVCLSSGCVSPLVSYWENSPDVPPPATDKPAEVLYDYEHSVERLPEGQKWTVAILRFGDTREIAGVPYGTDSNQKEIAKGDVSVNVEIKDEAIDLYRPNTWPQLSRRSKIMLKHALIESNAFVVVERERIEEILREINFGGTDYVDSTKKVDSGIWPAKYIIEGSLGLNEDKTLGPKNRIACYLNVYDITTAKVTVSAVGLGRDRPEAIEDAVFDLIRKMPKGD